MRLYIRQTLDGEFWPSKEYPDSCDPVRVRVVEDGQEREIEQFQAARDAWDVVQNELERRYYEAPKW